MKEGYIAVIDSGIGGLNVLSELIKTLPNEKFIYYGDNNNAPYGNRNKADLLDLSANIVVKLLHYNLKAIVIGCNTLSATILAELIYYFPNVKFFGVFPPVEILTARKRNTLLLCTPNTSRLYKNTEYLTVLSLENLANDIEKKIFNISRVNFKNHLDNHFNCKNEFLTTFDTFLTTKNEKNNFQPQKGRFEAVILGCTHYFFIKNQIFNHFQPRLIVRGEIFTVNRVKRFLEYSKSLVKNKENLVLFLGECGTYNEKVFNLITNNSKKI